MVDGGRAVLAGHLDDPRQYRAVATVDEWTRVALRRPRVLHDALRKQTYGGGGFI